MSAIVTPTELDDDATLVSGTSEGGRWVSGSQTDSMRRVQPHGPTATCRPRWSEPGTEKVAASLAHHVGSTNTWSMRSSSRRPQAADVGRRACHVGAHRIGERGVHLTVAHDAIAHVEVAGHDDGTLLGLRSRSSSRSVKSRCSSKLVSAQRIQARARRRARTVHRARRRRPASPEQRGRPRSPSSWTGNRDHAPSVRSCTVASRPIVRASTVISSKNASSGISTATTTSTSRSSSDAGTPRDRWVRVPDVGDDDADRGVGWLRRRAGSLGARTATAQTARMETPASSGQTRPVTTATSAAVSDGRAGDQRQATATVSKRAAEIANDEPEPRQGDRRARRAAGGVGGPAGKTGSTATETRRSQWPPGCVSMEVVRRSCVGSSRRMTDAPDFRLEHSELRGDDEFTEFTSTDLPYYSDWRGSFEKLPWATDDDVAARRERRRRDRGRPARRGHLVASGRPVRAACDPHGADRMEQRLRLVDPARCRAIRVTSRWSTPATRRSCRPGSSEALRVIHEKVFRVASAGPDPDRAGRRPLDHLPERGRRGASRLAAQGRRGALRRARRHRAPTNGATCTATASRCAG